MFPTQSSGNPGQSFSQHLNLIYLSRWLGGLNCGLTLQLQSCNPILWRTVSLAGGFHTERLITVSHRPLVGIEYSNQCKMVSLEQGKKWQWIRNYTLDVNLKNCVATEMALKSFENNFLWLRSTNKSSLWEIFHHQCAIENQDEPEFIYKFDNY